MFILRVVGARPQFMQIPVLHEALIDNGHKIFLLHTGQHYDHNLSDLLFKDLGIQNPDLNLNVGSGSHGKTTAKMLEGIEQVILDIKPDIVLLDGDTNSTLSAALAASKLNIPIVHIEAGLRDWDRRRPEEINRVLTDHLSSLNCAPISRALTNLENENLGSKSVLVGDVLLDCFLHYQKYKDFSSLEKNNLIPDAYHLATIHRPENTTLDEKSRFNEILNSFSMLDKPVIYPMHPRAKACLELYENQFGPCKNLIKIEPVSYFQILGLLESADAVFTDSGGLSREAVWSGKKCIMLFQKDTWHDFLENNWAQIGKYGTESILEAFAKATPAPSQKAMELFGNGKASHNIAKVLKNEFN